MSKKDKIQTRYNFFEKLFFALLTALFGLFGYGFINIYSLKFWQILIIILACISFLTTLIFISKILKKYSDEMEDL